MFRIVRMIVQVIFYYLKDHSAHPGYFENRIPLKPALGACAASQTTVLHMKRLSQTESPIFVILCVLCFQRQSFFTFIGLVGRVRATRQGSMSFFLIYQHYKYCKEDFIQFCITSVHTRYKLDLFVEFGVRIQIH